MDLKRLVLTTDFSGCARQAYAPACDLARRAGAHLDLVHCLEHPSQYIPEEFGMVEGTFDTLRKVRREKLKREVDQPAFEGIDLEPHLLDGNGPQAVLNFTEKVKADLVILTSHGHAGLKRFLLGSFAESVLRTAVVPVLTFKCAEEPLGKAQREFAPKRILFPYDFSKLAEKALDPLRWLARTYGSKVLVLHVWKTSPEIEPASGPKAREAEPTPGSLPKCHHDRLLAKLEDFASRALTGIDHHEEVMGGDPASSIIVRATTYDANLICMATHGWTGFRRAMLGSVAERVLRGMECPTLIVRPPDLA